MKCSLRTRLLLGIIAGMLLLLVVFSLVVYTAIERALTNQFDSSLKSTASILAASVEQDGNEIEIEFEVKKMPEFHRSEHPTCYQLWHTNGAALVKSPSLGDDDLVYLKSPADQSLIRDSKLPQGRQGRAVSLTFTPRVADNEGHDSDSHTERISLTQTATRDANDLRNSGRTDSELPTESTLLTLVVARDTNELQDDLTFLRWLLLIASAGTITLSLVVAAAVVRRGLNPLNLIAAEIAGIKENDLAVRIAAASAPGELIPIRNRLNDLLDRLETAFKREKRFTGDVAHELRTPLAGMRSTIEVTLTRTRDADEYKTSLCECLAIAADMQAMVDSLLRLVRIEAGQTAFRSERIQLNESVDSCWSSFAAKASERRASFENRIASDVTLETDPEHTNMVLSNLLGNAIEYVDAGGRIGADARCVENSIELTVSNTGCCLTGDQVAQVFDCFWRGDCSRSQTGVHCGLGLALVKRIVEALGGTVSAGIDAGVFSVTINLPSRLASD